MNYDHDDHHLHHSTEAAPEAVATESGDGVTSGEEEEALVEQTCIDFLLHEFHSLFSGLIITDHRRQPAAVEERLFPAVALAHPSLPAQVPFAPSFDNSTTTPSALFQSPSSDSTTTTMTVATSTASSPPGDDHHNRNNDATPATFTSTSNAPSTRPPLVPFWTRLTSLLHSAISTAVTTCAVHAAKNPKTYILVMATVAIVLLGVGMLTNFQLVLDLDVILTPVDSRPLQHSHWIDAPHGFGVNPTRLLQVVFHNHGTNVLHAAQTRRVLQAVQQIRTTPGFTELCQQGVYLNFQNELDCRIFSVSGYWRDHSLEEFDVTVGNNDTALREYVSGSTFADGSPVLHDTIVGNYQRNSNGTLISAQSYLVRLEFPDTPDTNSFEADMLGRLDDLRREWMKMDSDQNNNNNTTATILTMDFMTIYAYQLEALNAILGDLYLVAFSALLMVGFTCAIFYKRNPKESRMLLGVASVTTIGCSILMGNGLMFLCGVPYSFIHQMLPFVIFGIGLDDTFIITGAYFRTDPTAPIEDRIRTTMQEVGWSISVTTLTTVFAFSLGFFTSSFPGVHWLCLSAVATIAIDFYLQITLFVAFLVLDERRMQAQMKDCCFWQPIVVDDDDDAEEQDVVIINDKDKKDTQDDKLTAKHIVDVDDWEEQREEEEVMQVTDASFSSTADGPSVTDDDHEQQQQNKNNELLVIQKVEVNKPVKAKDHKDNKKKDDTPNDRRSLPERLMSWYADVLLYPKTKVLVMVAFTTFFAYMCWNVTYLTQEFDVGSYVRDDSYLRNIFTSLHEYSSVVRPMALYFRHVDQSDPEVQRQMIDYVEAMEALPQVLALDDESEFDNNLTSSMWNADGGGFTGGVDKVRPFCWVRDLQQLERSLPEHVLTAYENLTFAEKLDITLNDKILREVYGQDIIRDDEGNIIASRCFLFLQDLDLKDVEAQIDMLFDQRSVSESQPINQLHPNDWAFFAYDDLFGYWEAYSVSVQELWFTIVAGVVAVTFIAFVFIPHWTGGLLVFPLIVVLYVNMLGSLQCLGLHINGITYVCVVVSIGLLVDFLIHVLLRYYECPPGMTRDERVKETLETMGASILIGGATTFLAVIPLAASSIKIFLTVFNAFFAMVTLGCTHGLILLPVVLSLVGPTTTVRQPEGDNSSNAGDHGEKKPEDDGVLPESPASGLTVGMSASFGEPVDVDVDLYMETLRAIEENSERGEEIPGDREETRWDNVQLDTVLSEASA